MKVNEDNNEDQYNLIGLNAFFNTEDDKNIDWKEFFHLTEDEIYYASNNNQMIEVDKNEDQICGKYL